MFTSLGEQELAVAFSADGIRWSRFLPCPAVNPYQVDGTHYHALWVEERGEYVGFTRLRDPRTTGAAEVGSIRGAWPPRQVGRTASTDFRNWTPASAVLEGSDENLRSTRCRYANLYLGLPAIHNQRRDRVWTELAWSPEDVTWHTGLPRLPAHRQRRPGGQLRLGMRLRRRLSGLRERDPPLLSAPATSSTRAGATASCAWRRCVPTGSRATSRSVAIAPPPS